MATRQFDPAPTLHAKRFMAPSSPDHSAGAGKRGTTMSIARALTVRLRRNVDSPLMSPPPVDMPASLKRGASVIDRKKISSPVELISSTNLLSYNAPDVETIREIRQASSSSSLNDSSTSADESDSSDNARSSTELTDASSVDASPCEPEPKTDYMSSWYKEDSRRASIRKSCSSTHLKSTAPESLPPAIPKRSQSHSRSAHIALARKRSLQSLGTQSPASSRSISRASSLREPRTSSNDLLKPSSASIDTTTNSSRYSFESSHPFGRELAQLSEVAEELSGVMRDTEHDDDMQVMLREGLCKWTVDDYLRELRPLYLGNFDGEPENHPAALAMEWI